MHLKCSILETRNILSDNNQLILLKMHYIKVVKNKQNLRNLQYSLVLNQRPYLQFAMGFPSTSSKKLH